MMKKLLFLLIAFVASSTAAAQGTNGTWTSGSATYPTWDTSGIVGHGVAETCPSGEYFTAAQGGCPPAYAYEPAAIDESTNYTRSQWVGITPGGGICFETDPLDPHYGEDTGCRPWHGEDKIRLTCGFSHFASNDPLLFPGMPGMSHDHTFFGNESVDAFSTYTTLRNSPKSTCAGGPIAASGYWITSTMFEIASNVFVPIIPEGLEAYYNNDPRVSPKLVRLFRGLTVIGGALPSDPSNSARMAELEAQPPAGPGTHWTINLRGGAEANNDGFMGYKCVNRTTGATLLLATNDNDTHTTRSWLNADGTNPWGSGNCEGANFQIWSYDAMPTCWNGKDLTSPNGRDHWRYTVAYNGVEYCPRGWWRTPGLTAIHFYPAFTHAQRKKMWLSSDMMDPVRANWKQPGTTLHSDWMMGWDDFLFQTAEIECMGLTINNVTRAGGTGTLAQGRTCATNIWAANSGLNTGSSPNILLSRNPIVSQPNLGSVASKFKFGPVVSGTKISGSMQH